MVQEKMDSLETKRFSETISRLQRLFGIFDFPVAMSIMEAGISYLRTDRLPEAEKRRTLQLLTAILRQLLAIYPLQGDLLRTFMKWSAIAPQEKVDTEWIHLLKRTLRMENPHWRRERDEFFAVQGDDPEELSRVIGQTSNPLILYDCVLRLWKGGCWETCLAGMKSLLAMPYAPFVSALFGWAALGAGDLERAKRFSRLAAPSFLRSNLMAEISLREGKTEEAKRWWEDSLQREPFQPWLYYRLWELDQPAPSADILKGKRIFVFLYTFNKREETLQTLSSLLASKIGSSHIVVLNNGSTAFSPQAFEADVRRIAKGYPLQIIHLPVNVGAPAARNWLWHLPEARDADYIAYLDDDVILPKDWLILYLQDLEQFPSVVVVGPKVQNPGLPRTIQYVYRFFDEVGERKIRFTPTAPFAFDLGQYSIRRPCLSVMGCCHLFHRKRWERLGLPDFDIRFSPSQVDDLEHDLQIWKHGGEVLYDGRVEIVHLQEAGKTYTRSRASWAHVWGNHMKMEAKFSAQELEAIDRAVREQDDAFFRMVCRFLPNIPEEVSHNE